MSQRLALAGRWLIVVLGLAVIAGVGADLWRRAQPAEQYARAIAAGYAEPSRQLDADAAEDEQVTEDANEAGYMWAERRGLTDPADCAGFEADFRAGCEAWAKEQAAARSSVR